MASDFGTAGRSGTPYSRPADRSAGVGRSPVSTPKGRSETAVRYIEHSQGTRSSNKGAH